MTRTVRLCGQDVEQPGHICAFFSSREEEYETILPYLKEGVDAGEKILNVLSGDRLDDRHDRLARVGIVPDGDRVRTAAASETYLSDGRFDMDRMCDLIHDTLADSAKNGRRVRTVGWMDWMQTDPPGVDRVMEYEARMNLLVPGFDCTFMCVYDLAALGGDLVADIMATHPYVILDGQVRRNAFYVPPETYLRQLFPSA